jgi:hypothetical protein
MTTYRVCDYLLGGKGNFAADRAVGDKAMHASPHLVTGARANRAFLGRAVYVDNDPCKSGCAHAHRAVDGSVERSG